MTDRELKPCPFCGGGPYLSKDHDPDTTGTFYAYKCRICRASAGEKYAVETCPVFYAELREAWNTRAAFRPEAQGVKVKPLEWEMLGNGKPKDIYKSLYHAGSGYGVYYICHSPRPGSQWCWTGPSNSGGEWFDGPDEAKAAAQADYEARILSALDRPEAQDGVAEAAKVLLAEHERCSAIPIGKRTHAEQCAAQMGKNRLRALSQGGK